MRHGGKRLKPIGLLALAVFQVTCGCAVRNRPLREAGMTLPLRESVVIDLSIESRHTGRKVPFKVYLPSGYGGGERYPVWYGLHGHGKTETMWIHAGIVQSADRLIRAGEIRPLVMVFPYVRDATLKEIEADFADDGKFGERTSDRFLSKELVPYMDSHFDTVRSAEGRFIGGFSMGGAIALRVAFHHPALFGKVGGYSPAVTSNDFSSKQLERWLFPNDDIDGIRDVRKFARGKKLDRLSVYLDAGTVNDPFTIGVRSLYEALLKRGVPAEFHLYEGGHSLDHNRGDFGQYLRFYVPADTVPYEMEEKLRSMEGLEFIHPVTAQPWGRLACRVYDQEDTFSRSRKVWTSAYDV
jgi:enterochelin esterase-like enzyme